MSFLRIIWELQMMFAFRTSIEKGARGFRCDEGQMG